VSWYFIRRDGTSSRRIIRTEDLDPLTGTVEKY
jgi:hypothetical protein